MADNNVTRKRSRSPTDAEQPKETKRLNLGATPESSDDRNAGNKSPSGRAENDSSVKAEQPDGAVICAEPDTTKLEGKEGGPPVPQSHISMRCLIVTQDASIIIGRQGAHVNEIRTKSGAKVMVSESIPGNPERILNVGGPLDAVSKAFGLIVRRINDEPFDVPSVPGSRAVTIKFMIPNSRMGSVIGKGGSKIKEIQEASGARLTASEGMLPGSSDRVLSVAGVADAIHIATYYIGNVLIDANERNPTSSSTGTSYRPYSSQPRGGQSFAPRGPPPPMYNYGPPPPLQLQEQKIYIPNDLVGCIIGKGGSKINEIRGTSQCTIKIMEPGAPQNAGGGPENERLVVITGAQHNIQLAVSMLHHRLEQEKQKKLAAAVTGGTGGAPPAPDPLRT